MRFEDSFHITSLQYRKISLESIETNTTVSSLKSSQKSQDQKYKTQLCRFWRNYVQCPFGLECSFAHGLEEMRGKNISSKFKTSTCKKFIKNGFCPYGDRCQFSHSVEIMSSVFPKKSKLKVFYQSSTIRYSELLEEITSLDDLDKLSSRLQRVKPTIFKVLTSAQDFRLS